MNGLDALTEVGLEAGGLVKGAAVALVTQNQDPDGLGRVKVRYPWRHDSAESHWARIAVPMAGAGRGTVFYPEVGDEVLVLFEREDMRFPYVIGGLWNGKDKPPEANSDGKNDIRLIKSRKGHLLRFDDGKAKGTVELKLNDGKRLTIDDDGITIDDGSGNSVKIESKGGEVSVKAATTLKVSAPTISIEATGTMTLKANGNMTIQGAMVSIN